MFDLDSSWKALNNSSQWINREKSKECSTALTYRYMCTKLEIWTKMGKTNYRSSKMWNMIWPDLHIMSYKRLHNSENALFWLARECQWMFLHLDLPILIFVCHVCCEKRGKTQQKSVCRIVHWIQDASLTYFYLVHKHKFQLRNWAAKCFKWVF